MYQKFIDGNVCFSVRLKLNMSTQQHFPTNTDLKQEQGSDYLITLDSLYLYYADIGDSILNILTLNEKKLQ